MKRRSFLLGLSGALAAPFAAAIPKLTAPVRQASSPAAQEVERAISQLASKEVGAQILLTDKALRSLSPGSISTTARLMGDSLGRKIAQDIERELIGTAKRGGNFFFKSNGFTLETERLAALRSQEINGVAEYVTGRLAR